MISGVTKEAFTTPLHTVTAPSEDHVIMLSVLSEAKTSNPCFRLTMMNMM